MSGARLLLGAAWVGIFTLTGCGTLSRMEPAASTADSRGAPIVHREIEGSTARDAYELIQALRPHWLSVRGPRSILGEPVLQVYVNDIHFGDVGQLRGYGLQGVRKIEYMDPSSATLRWGTGHARGAVLICTERSC